QQPLPARQTAHSVRSSHGEPALRRRCTPTAARMATNALAGPTNRYGGTAWMPGSANAGQNGPQAVASRNDSADAPAQRSRQRGPRAHRPTTANSSGSVPGNSAYSVKL